MVKSHLKLAALAIAMSALSAAADGQVTPNIGLNIPPTGTPNWGPLVNQNFSVLDLLLSGNAPIPGMRFVTPGTQPTCSSTTRGNLFIVQGNGITTADSVQICVLLASGAYTWQNFGSGSSTGTVTSVGITPLPWVTVTPSTITNAGTFVFAPATGQSSHLVIGTCGAGTSFGPCSLTTSDIPGTGNGLKFATYSGLTPTALNCARWDGSGNIVDSGAPCAAGSGVITFNGRSGMVTLLSADVTTALGYIPLVPANNLSDIASPASARANLGLNTAATQPSTAFDAAGAAAGVLASSAQKANNLSDLTSAATARTNLGLNNPTNYPTLNQSTTGTAAFANALAATPTGCAGGTFATGIAANGNLTCATPAGGGNVSTSSNLVINNVPKATGTTTIADGGFAYPASQFVGISDTQVLTNKSIDGSEITSGTIAAARIPILNQNTTGQSGTTLAFASAPTGCTGSQFATGIATNGNLTCSTPPGGGNVSTSANLASGNVPKATGTTTIADGGFAYPLSAFVGIADTQTLTNKSIAGSEINSGTVAGTYVAPINLAASGNGGVTGNLPVGNLNSGVAAGSTTFWRGDGTWAVPTGTGTVTNFIAATGSWPNWLVPNVTSSTSTPTLTVTPSAQGNGAKVQLSTGSTTLNDCVKYDTNGNAVDAGAPCGTTSLAFSGLTGATNTTAAMLVGSGASLGVTGTGTIAATSLGGITVTGTPSVGYVPIATSASAATWQAPTVAAFSGLAGGTNNSAAMIVGTGASLTVSGSGTNNATSIAGITITGTPTTGYVPTATSSSTATWQAPTGTSAFSSLTSGTNATATMIVGTGASLTVSGTGAINATAVDGVTITGTPSVGYVATATSGTTATWQAQAGGSGFAAITAGTNTSAAMVLGTGSSLSYSGSGTNNASSVQGVAISGTPTAGMIPLATSGTAAVWTQPASGSAALTFTSIPDGTCQAADGGTTITTTGATLPAGSAISIGVPAGFTGSAIKGVVTASNTVTVSACNLTGATLTITSGTYQASAGLGGGGGGGGGGDAITSPNATLAVGGTSANTTLDVSCGPSGALNCTGGSGLDANTAVVPLSANAATITGFWKFTSGTPTISYSGASCAAPTLAAGSDNYRGNLTITNTSEPWSLH